jgi:hypothetical protein
MQLYYFVGHYSSLISFTLLTGDGSIDDPLVVAPPGPLGRSLSVSKDLTGYTNEWPVPMLIGMRLQTFTKSLIRF